MRLSHFADYAVVLMTAAARHCGASQINVAMLASETGMPLATSHKIIGLLSRAGLLKTTRGQGGGIRLARPPATISLADIIEAVEGPIALTACSEGRHDCARAATCGSKPHWHIVNHAVRGALADINLLSIANNDKRRAAPPVVMGVPA